MKQKNKRYRITMPVYTQEVVVSARNQTEAKRKAYAMLDRKKPSKMVMKNQVSVDES